MSGWLFDHLLRTLLLNLTPRWVGISQVEQKKQREERRKDETTGSRQQNIRRWGLRHFSGILCVWMCLAIVNALWNSQQLPKILIHVGNPFTASLCCLLCQYGHSLTAQDPSLPVSLSLIALTLLLHVLNC